MPRFQTLLSDLNTAFNRHQISKRVDRIDAFGPDRPLDEALAEIVSEPGSVEHRAFRNYIRKIPPAIQEGLRSTIYSALRTSPPTLITYAWAPGYDFEATYWQAPDTDETRGGITILIKSRYPADRHPLDTGGDTSA